MMYLFLGHCRHSPPGRAILAMLQLRHRRSRPAYLLNSVKGMIMIVCLLSTLLIDLVPPHQHLHPWTGQAWDQNSRLADKDMASA